MGFRMKGPTFFSTKGYKKDSPDVDKPHNVINSGDITMEDVEFDVRGEDNLGNVKIMKPGKNYKFPGNIVKETPLKQDKKEFKGINWDTLENVTVDGKTPKEIKKENLQKERDKWNQDLIDLRKLSDKKRKPVPRPK